MLRLKRNHVNKIGLWIFRRETPDGQTDTVRKFEYNENISLYVHWRLILL